MFLCVSPNPAIDKRITLPSLAPGEIHRARTVQAFPGGKSAHVAMVLRALGHRPSWLGFLGGDSGNSLRCGLKLLGIDVRSAAVSQPTRMNLELLEADGRITEILEPGPRVAPSEQSQFEEECRAAFALGGSQLTVIFSGSLPEGVAPDFYARLISLAHQSRCRTFLDTSGEPLCLGLSAQPSLVKPNREEAELLLGMSISSLPAAVDAIQQLHSLGASGVALSIGAEGLLYSASRSGPAFFAPALSLATTSTVGCGDAALAGFAIAIASGESPQETLRLAAACAAANCIAASPGAALPADIQRFKRQIQCRPFLRDPSRIA